MDCEKFRAMLDAYIDGELNADEAQALINHANTCAPCAKELEAANALKDMLRQMKDVEVPVPLQAQAAWREAVRGEARRRKMRRWVRIAGTVAAAIVLVAGSTLILNRQAGSEFPQQASTLALPENETRIIARDGDADVATAAAGQETDYSAWRKIATTDIPAAMDTVASLAQEYSGNYSCTAEDVCCVELPYAYMNDFLNAVKAIGVELDSETVDAEVETAVIYIQFSAE